jgi:hypothetical protein
MNLVKPDPNIQEPSIQQQEGFFPPIVQNVHSIVN